MHTRDSPYGLIDRLSMLVLVLSLSGCDVPVLDGLDEPQANDLIVCLSAVGITAEKQGRLGRFTVSVARDDLPVAWRIARSRGLPQQAEPAGGGLLMGPRRDAERPRQAAVIAAFLRADPAITDARVVLGDRGAAVSLRAVEPSSVDRARVEARVRAVSGLDADQPVALDVHPLTGPSPPLPTTVGRTETEVLDENTAGASAGLWLASIAVTLMLAGCGLIGWRIRGARQLRGIHT